MSALRWTVVHFGRHQGLTLPQVVFRDADYFFWACEQNAFHGMLGVEALRVRERARHIRIPDRYGSDVSVEYQFDPFGRFVSLRLVQGLFERGVIHYSGVNRALYSTRINMEAPRIFVEYDKRGNKIFAEALKRILFGSSGYRVSKMRAEAFFHTEDNFALAHPENAH